MGSAVTEFRLVDVPELGYHTTDRPFPRGELQLKTQSMIQGYHKQAKACRHCPNRSFCTAALYTDDFALSHDVGEKVMNMSVVR